MSAHFTRQQLALVLYELLDLGCPRCGIDGFRVPILRALVTCIKVVTQILAGVDARLDQLGSVLVQPSSLGEKCPTERTLIQIVDRKRDGAHGK